MPPDVKILRLKRTEFDLRWGSRGAYSALPGSLAVFKGGLILRGAQGKGKSEGEGEREGMGFTGPVSNCFQRARQFPVLCIFIASAAAAAGLWRLGGFDVN